MRSLPFALCVALSAFAAPQMVLAQDGYIDLCEGQQLCLSEGCKGDTLRFEFRYEADANGVETHTIVMPTGTATPAAFEPSTQGFTWSTERQVFAMLYLYNEAHGEFDPAEFMLMVTGIDTDISDTTLFSGTCEIVD